MLQLCGCVGIPKSGGVLSVMLLILAPSPGSSSKLRWRCSSSHMMPSAKLEINGQRVYRARTPLLGIFNVTVSVCCELGTQHHRRFLIVSHGTLLRIFGALYICLPLLPLRRLPLRLSVLMLLSAPQGPSCPLRPHLQPLPHRGLFLCSWGLLRHR